MNKFVLNDIREFCLCSLHDTAFFTNYTTEYIPTYYRVFLWKILKCNNILNLTDVNVDAYMEELQKKISLKKLQEIIKIVLPIYQQLKEYTLIHFQPTSLYLTLTENGELKEEIANAFKKAGLHSWGCYLSPVTEKIWVAGDFTVSEFYDRISIDIPKEWYDFHQRPTPQIRDE